MNLKTGCRIAHAATLIIGLFLFVSGHDGAGVLLMCVAILLWMVSEVTGLDAESRRAPKPRSGPLAVMYDIGTVAEFTAALEHTRGAIIRLSQDAVSFNQGEEGLASRGELVEYAIRLGELTRWLYYNPVKIEEAFFQWHQHLAVNHAESLI